MQTNFRLKFIFLLNFLFISIFSFSQVKDTVLLDKVLKELKLDESEIHMELVADKILPFSVDKTFFVIPKYRTKEKDEYGFYFYEFDVYVIIADNKNGKVLTKFYEPNAWTSDAINLNNISIDTGLYNLNKKTRAVGIRVNYTGSSRPNPYNQTDLSLFITENDKLKRVLKNFTISDFHGEWDTNCSGEFEEVNSNIDIGKTMNNGLYNLIIKSKIKKIRNIPTNNDCVEKIKTHQRVKNLKFNGIEYH
ncbi:hypothetical protein PG275_06225 [Riemerella anatipestifer]|uniref:hypothetical protein n=1 Tax=Riemerella anatipestifer TaxID=34085 RepID=UPI002A8FF3E0|nr:hypothetical protein [Riemerella anatipestifer]